ncbi:alpha/beta fold hydrolase [Aeromicrobium sp. NPDC092404]|uniref:alpha/beta hydrolase n=1 Tax=Aeromicrobium sp. NPDC092404 TaxID=3154976 RepID=UPI00342280E5
MALDSAQKSTNVRPSQHLLRGAFRVLEHVAPSLGARWADRWWFALPPSRVTELPPGHTPFEVRSQGRTIRGHRWGSGPVVYLVHGWGGNETQLGRLVPPLVASGFTVVTHDAPSHGTSDAGEVVGQSHAVEMGHAIDAVAAVHGPAHAVIAHSMGGLATGLTLQHGWLGTDRLVLIAPMVRISDHLPTLQAGLGFGPRTRARLEQRALRRVGLAVEEVNLVRIADEIDKPPLLVVHDRTDRLARYASAVQLVEHWAGARLTTTEGLGHQRILADDAVVRQVVAFVVAGALEELDETA